MAHAQSKVIGGHLVVLDRWQIKDQALRWLLFQNRLTRMFVMAILFEDAIIRINVTTPYLYAPLLMG